MTDLATLYGGLIDQPAESLGPGAYSGIAIPDSSHHIAKDQRGRPVILLSAEATEVRPASIVLENLRIEHGIRCNIHRRSSTVVDDRFTIVQCQSEDPVLQRCFIDLCQAIVSELTDAPTQRSIADLIDRIALLFRAMELPSRRSIQGLWGELALIAHARDVVAMASAWHNDACERYDFAACEQRLEVKTASNRLREHFFSHDQANPPASVQCVVASMFVEPSTGGRALGDLWDCVRMFVSSVPELRLRVDEVCFASLGRNWREARSQAFDEQLALSSLAFYDVRDIPRIGDDVPNGVTDVRFRSNLSLGVIVGKRNRPLSPLVSLLM